jgi:hypothetical protein
MIRAKVREMAGDEPPGFAAADSIAIKLQRLGEAGLCMDGECEPGKTQSKYGQTAYVHRERLYRVEMFRTSFSNE